VIFLDEASETLAREGFPSRLENLIYNILFTHVSVGKIKIEIRHLKMIEHLVTTVLTTWFSQAVDGCKS
jgi:hypothetical protein